MLKTNILFVTKIEDDAALIMEDQMLINSPEYVLNRSSYLCE